MTGEGDGVGLCGLYIYNFFIYILCSIFSLYILFLFSIIIYYSPEMHLFFSCCQFFFNFGEKY